KGPMPRGRHGSRLVEQSAAVVRTCRALSCPSWLPDGQSRMQRATAAGGERRLRPRTGLLVQGLDTASDPAAHSAQAEAAADAGRLAADLQKDRRGALIIIPGCEIECAVPARRHKGARRCIR